MKVLELTTYSKGICGVWNRVKEESKYLSRKGHEVKVFSSYFTKGSNEIASSRDSIEGIQIQRFKGLKLGGESFTKWYGPNVEKEVIAYNPDIIIVHGYRHHHTTAVLTIAKKLKSKVFLVTHAPFIDRNETRSKLASLVVNFYDKKIAPRTLPQFTKIISITKWEMANLKKLGVPQRKIVYIPNGVSSEFFTQKNKAPNKEKVLFLGRISPIKDLETLLYAISLVPTNVHLEIVGLAETYYLKKLKTLIAKLKINKKVKISPPIYDLRSKIEKLDSCAIFVLPSKREAMPQGLIEAMARGKICIASKTKGSEEVITSNRDGYLFDRGNAKALANQIIKNIAAPDIRIGIAAQKKAKTFLWDHNLKKLLVLFNSNHEKH